MHIILIRTSNALFHFYLADTTPPTIVNCPADIYTTVELGTPHTSVWWSEPMATDHSGMVTSQSTHEPGQSFHIGSTTVVYHFEDQSSNQAGCNFTVYVENGKNKLEQVLKKQGKVLTKIWKR